MARKSSSSGGGVVVLIVVGAFIGFVKENGEIIFILAFLVGAVWFLTKISKGSGHSSALPSTKVQPAENLYTAPSEAPVFPKSKQNLDPDLFWKKPGEPVTICGVTIDGGLVYFGSGLPAEGGYSQEEPALINPGHKLSDVLSADYRVRQVSYWPTYSQASPEARAAYLRWLAQGKSDPEADIGYVFLYYYGLERRVLADTTISQNAIADLPVVENEIRCLLDIYGSNGSFSGYASSLLDYLTAAQPNQKTYLQAPPGRASNNWALPFALKLALGQLAADGCPVPVAWAYAWLMSEPSIRLRTSAQRCPSEFQAIFAQRYQAAFGAGLKLSNNKTRLKLTYHAASPSFRVRSFEKLFDLPDISVLSSPIKKLQVIADLCMSELDSYSRVLGRSPDKAGSLDALLELPFILWPEQAKNRLLQTKATIEQANIPAAVPFSKLRSWLPEWKEVTKARMTTFAKRLSEVGLGIEPDPRFGGGIPSDDSTVVLFVDDAVLTSPNARYSAAALSLHFAVAVSLADGDANEAEKSLLARQLEEWLHLDNAERNRLRAHFRWLLTEKPGINGVKKRVETLPMAAREALGDFLAEVAHADNDVSQAEVKVLERIFKTLGLDNKALYSKLHAATGEPVIVRPAKNAAGGFEIPKPTKPSTTLQLDMSKVAALKAESEKVSAILGAIFTDETVKAPVAEDLPLEIEPDTPAESIIGLDAAHSDLVKLLCSRAEWTRAELEEVMADRCMMLDGALEHINEAAFDIFDMALSEGDDPVEINQDVVKEIYK